MKSLFHYLFFWRGVGKGSCGFHTKRYMKSFFRYLFFEGALVRARASIYLVLYWLIVRKIFTQRRNLNNIFWLDFLDEVLDYYKMVLGLIQFIIYVDYRILQYWFIRLIMDWLRCLWMNTWIWIFSVARTSGFKRTGGMWGFM